MGAALACASTRFTRQNDGGDVGCWRRVNRRLTSVRYRLAPPSHNNVLSRAAIPFLVAATMCGGWREIAEAQGVITVKREEPTVTRV